MFGEIRGVQAGCAEGCVRVINSPEEGVQLQPGEILVADGYNLIVAG